MAHDQQRAFFESVKEKYPKDFKKVKVIDCGSLDVNGSLKDMFEDSDYTGADIAEGKNVDIVCKTHEIKGQYDTVVSGEMLEHDEYWKKSLTNMYKICKPGGLIAISAATTGRPEHGTAKTNENWGTSPDYYCNVTEEMMREVFKDDMFDEMEFQFNKITNDIYFFGRKRA